MKHQSQKKILSFFLCAALAVSVLLLCVFAVTNEEFAVTYNGEIAENVVFSQNAKTQVALQGVPDGAELQWQIRMPHEAIWVDISGQTEETLTLSSALVSNIMDQTGSTAIRCTATVDGTEVVTEPVDVQMSFVVDSQPQAPAYVQENYVSYGDTYLTDSLATDVTVTVNYKYLSETGTEVFDSWVAKLEQDVPFQQTVTSPSTQGYKPDSLAGAEADTPRILTFDNGTATLNDDGSVTFDLSKVTQDIAITVIYQPVMVKYRVIYHTQNVEDDLYTLYHEETYWGYAGTTPDDPKNTVNGLNDFEIPGFTRLYYVPETIAADGSTVFKCYFDRNYYLINFELDGGYGVAPIYARYGDSVVVGDPVKSGYNFLGWDLTNIYQIDENGNETQVTEHYVNGQLVPPPYGNPDLDDLPQKIGVCTHNTPLLGNYTFRAVWGTGATTFTVVYWVQNANNNSYSYAYHISGVNATSADVLNQKTIKDYKIPNDDGTDSGDSITLTLPADNALEPYATLIYDITQDENGENAIVAAYAEEYTKTDVENDDYGVVIEGDGSTVFNIYFKRKEYTIHFYYARSYLEDGTLHYEIATNTEGYNNFYQGKGTTGKTVDDATWTEIESKPTLNGYEEYETERVVGTITYTYYYTVLTARYRENIEKKWPDSNLIADGYYFGGWCAQSESPYSKNTNNTRPIIPGPYLLMDEQMITDSTITKETLKPTHIMLARWTDSVTKWTFSYYVDLLEDDTYDASNSDYKTGNSGWAITQFKRYDSFEVDSYSSGGWDQPRLTFDGIFYYARWMDESNKILTYFYTRNKNSFQLNNFGEVSALESLKFGTALSSHLLELDSIDDYPDALEPDVYKFGGWYTGPNGSGLKVVIDKTATNEDGTPKINDRDAEEKIWYNPTMPDDNLILFAHWVPKEWTVTYYDLNRTLNSDAKVLKTVKVTHDTVMTDDERQENPTREGYTFAGWFYINDQGEKTAFNIRGMKVQQDMELFAEWTSKVPVEYTVYYKIKDGENEIEIAKPTTGYSFAGFTKTVIPKTGTELYENYQAGYFPDISSHSILMEMDSKENVFTFYYTQVDKVKYTVKYVDAQTGTLLEEYGKGPVSEAIVTEHAEPITMNGITYIPQSYSQQLVLSADESQNVITFYYVEVDNTGAFIVRYHLEKVDGTGYDMQSEYYYATAEANEVINALSDAKYQMSFVGFTLENTDDKQAKATGTIVAGKVIQLDLYYSRNEYAYTIQHMIVNTTTELKEAETGMARYGATVERTLSDDERTLTVDNIHYELVSVDVTKSVVIGEDAENNVITFFYEPKKTVLTISVTGLPEDCADTFLFKIMGPMELQGNDSCVELIVAIQGNGTVTIGEMNANSQVLVGLYAGTYEVTALTTWSYAYNLTSSVVIAGSGTPTEAAKADTPSIVLDSASGNSVTFTYGYVGSDWLGDEATKENKFAGIYVPAHAASGG